MSFKPGRTFGGQVAGSVHRKKNWASRRKWERKGETKKPGLQALEATVTSSALADPREASVLFLFAPFGKCLVPKGQYCLAVFWKHVVILPVWEM